MPANDRNIPAQAPEDFADNTVTWFESLFTTGSTLSTFFAGFTLTIAVTDSTKGNSREYAAISSLLFVLNVLLCSACSLVINFRKQEVKSSLRKRRVGAVAISLVSIVLQLLFLVAVLFFFLLMKAFAWAAGIVGISLTGLAILVAIIAWGVQFRDWKNRRQNL